MRTSVRFREAPSPGNSPVGSIYLVDDEEFVKLNKECRLRPGNCKVNLLAYVPLSTHLTAATFFPGIQLPGPDESTAFGFRCSH